MTATLTVHSRARDETLDAVRARLHTFIKRRVESLDVADDLTQDVLLRLLMSSDGRIENPTAWAYRVARNVIVDHYRTRGSRPRFDSDHPTAQGPAEDPFADDPHEAQRELAGCLRSLVDQLAEPYRSAVAAVDLDGQSQTDLAQAMGLSVSGMKSRVQRGRRQLRRLLTECCRVHTSPAGGITGYEPITGCKSDPTVGELRCCAAPARSSRAEAGSTGARRHERHRMHQGHFGYQVIGLDHYEGPRMEGILSSPRQGLEQLDRRSVDHPRERMLAGISIVELRMSLAGVSTAVLEGRDHHD